MDNTSNTTVTTTAKLKHFGFGLFLLLAGLALLAEQLGLISNTVKWGWPCILIAWGLSELLQRFHSR